jgi:hypothetical protein
MSEWIAISQIRVRGGELAMLGIEPGRQGSETVERVSLGQEESLSHTV